MEVSYSKWPSPALGREMELKRYGTAGRPLIVFPCQGGRFFEFEDFGMVEVVRPFIEEGQHCFVTVDSIDGESWDNRGLSPAARAARHEAWERYVHEEVVPFLERGPEPGLIAIGCSMGGYHAANFYFRRPDVFAGMISLSGLMRLDRAEFGISAEELGQVYFHSPLAYLPGLNDPWHLERYRRGRIIACAGQGAWDEASLADARDLGRVLAGIGVPAWIDVWGPDVCHDWPWWRRQLPYFLGKLGL